MEYSEQIMIYLIHYFDSFFPEQHHSDLILFRAPQLDGFNFNSFSVLLRAVFCLSHFISDGVGFVPEIER